MPPVGPAAPVGMVGTVPRIDVGSSRPSSSVGSPSVGSPSVGSPVGSPWVRTPSSAEAALAP